MAEFRKGNIFSEDAEALVNTVNCVGVMRREIALQFRKAFPENFEAYARACERGEAEPGRMFVFETGEIGHPRYIVNFPTKRHWRGKSRIEDIESGLGALVDEVRRRNIRSVAMPPLGSGLGGLDWSDVRPLIETALQALTNTHVVVFEPAGAPEARKMARESNAPRMTRGRAALVGLIDRYLRGLLDPFATLLEVHKLMYFMQVAGEPLQLDFRKGPYGPYAKNLRHVLNAIEGHFTTGYADGGDEPGKEIALLPGALERARVSLDKHDETRARFDRVANLVAGFESDFGLELLATVHWSLQHEPVRTIDALVACVHAWNERKKRFSERQIALAADRLVSMGWTCPPVHASSPGTGEP